MVNTIQSAISEIVDRIGALQIVRSTAVELNAGQNFNCPTSTRRAVMFSPRAKSNLTRQRPSVCNNNSILEHCSKPFPTVD
jgi:hypothetical protein